MIKNNTPLKSVLSIIRSNISDRILRQAFQSQRLHFPSMKWISQQQHTDLQSVTALWFRMFFLHDIIEHIWSQKSQTQTASLLQKQSILELLRQVERYKRQQTTKFSQSKTQSAKSNLSMRTTAQQNCLCVARFKAIRRFLIQTGLSQGMQLKLHKFDQSATLWVKTGDSLLLKWLQPLSQQWSVTDNSIFSLFSLWAKQSNWKTIRRKHLRLQVFLWFNRIRSSKQLNKTLKFFFEIAMSNLLIQKKKNLKEEFAVSNNHSIFYLSILWLQHAFHISQQSEKQPQHSR